MNRTLSDFYLNNFADEFAAALELKLDGCTEVGDQSWEEYTLSLLHEYKANAGTQCEHYKPMWRSLHEAMSKRDASTQPHLLCASLINTFADRLKNAFPVHEIDRNTLIDYLMEEACRAIDCE